MNVKKAYYAHSMRKYNTKIESIEYDFILKHFKGCVICPNKDLGELGGIEPYLKIIETTSALYVSEYMNCVGIGVFKECSFALSKKIPVFVLRKDEKDEYYIVSLVGIEKLPKSTSVFYGNLIV